jgi:hypothetical protein
VGATSDESCGSAAPDVWYRFTLSRTELVVLNTYGSAYDTRLALRAGSCAATSTNCVDDACGTLQSEIIATLAAAQQPDGYLNSYFVVKEPTKRWTNLRDWHELYCAGHMFEAAVAHFRSTGKRTLLDTLLRYADHIDATFGPGRRKGYPGHEQVELALLAAGLEALGHAPEAHVADVLGPLEVADGDAAGVGDHHMVAAIRQQLHFW